MTKVHATCVEIEGAAVLLRGPSGSGKSDLALRLMDGGARLVSDDYTEVEESEGRLVASAPPAIEGLMEVRGIGLIETKFAAKATVSLVVDLTAAVDVLRLPDPAACEILGVSLPLFKFAAFEDSTPAKIRLAMRIANGTVRRGQ